MLRPILDKDRKNVTSYHNKIRRKFTATELTKGLLKVYLISNDTDRLYKCKIKVPELGQLQALNKINTAIDGSPYN